MHVRVASLAKRVVRFPWRAVETLGKHVHWYFRDISDDPSEKELTQQDQFNNDEVALSEALVRETIQNSTDAQRSAAQPVRVRFAIVTPQSPESVEFFRKFAADLRPHLVASGLPERSQEEPPRLLVIEDFGTTGLRGAVDTKDEHQFCDFWRRFGRSHKQGSKGGRWGLGKLVFPSASNIRAVLGLTRREDDGLPWVMGQAVLRNHLIDSHETDSVGFWCRDAEKGGLPSSDPSLCNRLSTAASLQRKDELGLSLVVPFLQDDIQATHLIAATIKNYYFPILTGRLIVEVDETIIDATTFDTISETQLAGAISPSVLEFVRQIQASRGSEPGLVIPATWQAKGLTGELLGAEIATSLRDQFVGGSLISLRAPVTAAKAGGRLTKTHVDILIKAARPGDRTQTLVVRNAITVPGEGKKLTFADAHAALIATDDTISQLLGDAENPSHTLWNERAEKLRNGWQKGGAVLRRVRALLPELHALVADKIEREDAFALVDFFSFPRATRPASGNRPTQSRPADLPEGTPRAFRIQKKKGGFAIVPGPALATHTLPLKIRVRCAYDVLSGNPFRSFNQYDFSFFAADLKITKENAISSPKEPNEIEIEVREKGFKVEVRGFDPNRDLIVEAQL